MQQQDNNKPSSKNRKDQTQKKDKPLKNWAVFSGIGIQMAITIFLGNLLGVWLDKQCSTTFLEETITLIAIFLSMYIVIRAVNNFNK
ncbi:AtpZ/AtpI family protein [Psychroserpens sp. MEBiC05023]